MHRTLAAAAGLAVAMLASPLSAHVLRHLEAEVPVAAHQLVRIDFPIGELRVEAADVDRVTVDVAVRCQGGRDLDDCSEQAAGLELHTSAASDEVRVFFRGFPRVRLRANSLSLEGTIRVPRGHAVEIEMNIGELEIAGIERDLTANLEIGEILADLPDRTFGDVFLRSGIGETTLSTSGEREEGRRASLIGSELRRTGLPGRSKLHLETSIGEVAARFDTASGERR